MLLPAIWILGQTAVRTKRHLQADDRILARAATNLTANAAAELVQDVAHDIISGWYSAPNVRGTGQIMFAALSTLFLCAWTAFHPDRHIPARRSKLFLFLARCANMLLTMFLPELVLLHAIRQWREAKRIQREVNKGLHLPKRRDPTNWFRATGEMAKAAFSTAYVENSPDEVRQWTLKQAFFVVSGCLAVDSSDFWSTPTLALSGVAVAQLAELGILPDLSEEEVDARSNADCITKIFPLMQAGYFLANCLNRLINGLPLALLEIHVMIHVGFVFAMYGFWFYKPYNVESPVVLHDGSVKDIAAFLVCHDKSKARSLYESATGDCLRPSSWLDFVQMYLDLDRDGRYKYDQRMVRTVHVLDGLHPYSFRYAWKRATSMKSWEMEVQEASKKSSMPIEHSDSKLKNHLERARRGRFILLEALRASATQPEHRSSELTKCFPLSFGDKDNDLSDGIFRATPSTMGTYGHEHLIEPRILVLAIVGSEPVMRDTMNLLRYQWHVMKSLVNGLFALFGGKTPAFSLDSSTSSSAVGTFFSTLFKSVFLVILSYGAAHLAAWNYEFPSSTEKWLWRVSSLIILFKSGTLEAILEIVVAPSAFDPPESLEVPTGLDSEADPAQDSWGPKSARKKKTDRLSRWGPKIYYEAFAVFMAARLYILVEAFISLRSTPAGMFDSVGWSQYFPHVE